MPRPRTFRRSAFGASLALAIIIVSSAGAAPAGAQVDDSIYETCSTFNTIVATGGQPALDAIDALRAIGAPNPPGLDDAFDVLASFEDPTIDDPTADSVEAATTTLREYYEPICADVDVCALLDIINGTDADRARQAADWLDRLSAPSPPGIGAALSVLSGRVEIADTAGLVEDDASALETVNDWFGGACQLAITGRSDLFPMTMIGMGAVAVGASLVAINRREFV